MPPPLIAANRALLLALIAEDEHDAGMARDSVSTNAFGYSIQPLANHTPEDGAMRLPSLPSTRRSSPANPKRIVRSEHLRSASLDPNQRYALVDLLYGVYSETCYGHTRDEFAAMVFSAGAGRFALFYDADLEFAGFSYAAFEYLEHDGRRYALLNAGVFFRPGYHGGTLTGLFELRQALRFKLRHPRTPLVYVTRCSSPAAYRLLATVPRIYPSHKFATPADIDALARAASAQRRYVPVGEDPWIVRSNAIPYDASQLRLLDHDPDARFFAKLTPAYAEGEALLIWLPLDLANIAGGFVGLLRRRLAR
ncbi:hypothetical protein [Mycobacterium decipiens]|uniref:Uncharacterized protein n=1 Tax=Mycobacterium decipiens TaxID=1430326 RepID=A0A1X2LTF0_9MYCO|nr:hypothetical protein [Mycobacterium decipiens]OSC40070.1 hypothetical protein B8W66_14580 [Mycobacterium decipiens]